MSGYTVYTCRDREGAILYIGYTNNYPSRMYSHCYQSPWFGKVHRVEREDFPQMGAALDHERAMIERHTPPHNIRFTRNAAPREPWELPRRLIDLITATAEQHGLSRYRALEHLLEQGIEYPADVVATSPA